MTIDIVAPAALSPNDPERLLPELGLSAETHWAWAVVTRSHPKLPQGWGFALVRVHRHGEPDQVIHDFVGPISKRSWPDRLKAVEMDWVGPVVSEPALAVALGPCLWLGPLAIQGWWRQVREPGRPVTAEVRWHPNRGHELGLRWTNPAATTSDMKRARDGLLLLTGIATLGRPYDDTFWPELQGWIADFYSDRGRQPTEREAADHAVMRLDSLKEKYRHQFPGLAWPDWVRSLVADITPPSSSP